MSDYKRLPEEGRDWLACKHSTQQDNCLSINLLKILMWIKVNTEKVTLTSAHTGLFCFPGGMNYMTKLGHQGL